jgi:hypothetical protein
MMSFGSLAPPSPSALPTSLTLLPARWIIVDDESADETSAILA